jgi:hypothetical protein
MRLWIAVLMFIALFFGAAQAQAGSCSSFVVIESFDADSSTIEVDHSKGKMRKYFPKPDGTPTGPTKIPAKCRSKITKKTNLVVKATGGRLSMTQIRSNFQGNMLNDPDDPAWLPAKLNELIAGKTLVVAIIRAGMGKDAPLGVTTIYLPITEEEEAEITRLENLAEDA